MKRILQVVRKEFIQIRRDKGLMRMVVLAPMLQLVIYGYVVATDIRALPLAVFDQSNSTESRRLVDRFVFSGYFELEGHVGSLSEAERHLNSGRAMMVLVIPDDFARDVRRGVKAKVQLLVDGTNSNTATIAIGYAGGIVAAANQEKIEEGIKRKGLRMIEAGIREEPRVWFNPSLRAINYMVPGIICVLLMEMMVPLTAFSLVRERERGTIEQLMVTPLRAGEVLIGKTIPYIAIGLIDATLILTAGTFWFGVPLPHNLGALVVCTSLFIVVALSLGILVATVVSTPTGSAERTVRAGAEHSVVGFHVSDPVDAGRDAVVYHDSSHAILPRHCPQHHDEGAGTGGFVGSDSASGRAWGRDIYD